VIDLSSRDARVNFRNQSSAWTNGEIEIIDNGLALLHMKTQNGRLLRDTISDLPVVFIKVNTLPISLRLGQNTLKTMTQSQVNPTTGQIEFVNISERQIRFADFDENNSQVAELHRLEVTREIAHSWTSDLEIAAALPLQDSYFTQFEAISSWVTETPDDVQFFTRSDDNTQWYRTTSVFVDDPLATFNSREDFASVWRLIFTPNSEVEQNQVILKSNLINNLFALLSTP
jgi:hypothetical protein